MIKYWPRTAVKLNELRVTCRPNEYEPLYIKIYYIRAESSNQTRLLLPPNWTCLLGHWWRQTASRGAWRDVVCVSCGAQIENCHSPLYSNQWHPWCVITMMHVQFIHRRQADPHQCVDHNRHDQNIDDHRQNAHPNNRSWGTNSILGELFLPSTVFLTQTCVETQIALALLTC